MNGMKKTLTIMIVLGIIQAAVLPAADATDDNVPNLIVDKARIVVEELLLNRYSDEELPRDLVQQCSGLAIFPGMLKGAFFIGGSYGKGVVLKHQDGQWRGPAFISIGAGSLGIQFGGQSIDLVLVVMGEEAMNFFLSSKFKLGADVAVAAGPVGAQASAASEITLKGGVYSYSRSKGAFIGVSLEGAGLASKEEFNKAYYKTTDNAQVILSGQVKPPENGQRLITTLQRVK
ncbi:MAG: lipid-binding SYLF domain-containing protein [Desulfobacterales bacterium]|jgi:lipid-binding SYLF domain-containing protein